MRTAAFVLTVGTMLTAAATSAVAEPNSKSRAQIGVCIESDSTAFVCSSKDLSNVILQCSSGEGEERRTFFHKIDDLEHVLTETPTQGSFSCPDGATVEAVFVKSGSGKSIVPGLSKGTGEAFFSPAACPVTCPTVGGGGGNGGDSNGGSGGGA